MTISIIPLQPVPNQRLAVTLDGQACTLAVYQKRTGLYLDLAVLDAPIITGAVAEYANPLVRLAYLGFSGDLAFYDTQGQADPDYTGLGDRFFLAYLPA